MQKEKIIFLRPVFPVFNSIFPSLTNIYLIGFRINVPLHSKKIKSLNHTDFQKSKNPMNTIIVDDDPATQDIIESFAVNTKVLNLVKKCNCAKEASDTLLQEKIDLMFLDVVMPEISGIEFMNSLQGHMPQVIMISSNDNFAKDAFNLDAIDFLVKPISYPRFFKAITKAKKIHDNNSSHSLDENIFIKVNSRLMKLNASDILLVEAMADYVAVHTASQRYIVHSTMKAIESKLSTAEFVRIHNSFIVRVDKISEIEDNTLAINNKIIPISKSHRKNLMNRLKFL